MTHQTATCAETELPNEGAAPAWVHLLPLGTIKGRDGRTFYLGNPDHVIAASENGADLPIEYEHQIDDPSRRTKGAAVPAAGWNRRCNSGRMASGAGWNGRRPRAT